MRDKIDRYSIRMFWIFGLMVGAVAAMSMAGCNTAVGVWRDVQGITDGMLHVAETNGESSRGIRGR